MPAEDFRRLTRPPQHRTAYQLIPPDVMPHGPAGLRFGGDLLGRGMGIGSSPGAWDPYARRRRLAGEEDTDITNHEWRREMQEDEMAFAD